MEDELLFEIKAFSVVDVMGAVGMPDKPLKDMGVNVGRGSYPRLLPPFETGGRPAQRGPHK
jgi:hypothetical protein